MHMSVNAQGRYDQGRGADGLSAIRYRPARFGAGVRMSDRPLHVTGKPRPPASLDPRRVFLRAPTAADMFRQKKPAQASNKIRPGIKLPYGRSMWVPPRKRLSKAATIRQRQQFVTWMRNWAPDIFAAAKHKADQAERTDGALGQLAGWWETFSTSVTDLGGKYLQFQTQKEILDAQMERMKQGLPPLQTSEYAPTIAIKPDAGTTAEITGAIGAGFGKMLPFIAIGGVAMVLLMRRR